MKKLFSFITVFFLFAVMIFAQTDTSVITSPDVIKFLDFNIPHWVGVGVIIAIATLSATQTILAKIPTERSVKISGIIGKILDVLTLFPSDNKKGGGVH